MKETKLLIYKIFKCILGIAFTIYYRPKYKGKNNIPKEGPIILCGNHMNLYDQNLVILSTKRMVHYMAKDEYFKDKKVAWFFKLAGCIPVNRAIHDENAKNQALDILNNNYALGIFPEGTRNKTKDFLLPFKYGAVSLAQKTNATIIPFAITGKYKFYKNHLNIRFGTGFKVEKDEDLTKANNRLFIAVKDLKKEGLKEIEEGKI